MISRYVQIIAATALSLSLSATASSAGPLLARGETLGLATGAQLPEGVFAIDTSRYGQADNANGGADANVPALVWSTPFSAYNTRLELIVAQPEIFTTGTGGRTYAYNPAFIAVFAHDFGNDFGLSYFAGIRPGLNNGVAFNDTSYEQRLALSYTGKGYDLTAILSNGLTGHDSTGTRADSLMLELTATKKFGKFEFGFVGFATTDTSTPRSPLSPGRQRDVALGGLIGYDFGPVTIQGYATREVAQRNYQAGGNSNLETAGFLRAVIPLYVVPKVAASMEPIRARY